MTTTTQSIPADATEPSLSQGHVVHQVHVLLRWLFTAVPIVAGADKFSNLLARWADYLNPRILDFIPLSPPAFMHAVGVIEIVAGFLVLFKPRWGGFLVMAWLLGIALQLLLWGRYLDVAVRDVVMALGGALTLARLTPFARRTVSEL